MGCGSSLREQQQLVREHFQQEWQEHFQQALRDNWGATAGEQRAAFVRVPTSHTPVRGEFGAASRHRGGAGQPRRREAHRSGRDPSALKQRKRTTALPATSGINTSA